MKKESFHEMLYPEFMKRGYIRVKHINNIPYNSKDLYFCPHDPDHYMITVNPEKIEIEKCGTESFKAVCRTVITDIEDIDDLHQELKKIILEGDESSLQKKQNTGCAAVLLFCLSLIIIFL